MTAYQLTGNPASPFAQKITRILAYKGLEGVWSNRPAGTRASIVLTAPDGVSRHHSEDCAALIEARHPEPALIPGDPASAAMSHLLSAIADQWLGKARLQQRWALLPDRQHAAERLRHQNPGTPGPALAGRMLAQLERAGIAPDTYKTLIASYRRLALRLNQHFQHHLYLFGNRPSHADFALAVQFDQMLDDPTPGQWLREQTPFLAAWCVLMRAPFATGSFSPFADLELTLRPVLEREILRTYLPWAVANAASAERGRARFSVTLADGLYEQPAEPVAAAAFAATRRAMKGLMTDVALDDLFPPAHPARGLFAIPAEAA